MQAIAAEKVARAASDKAAAGMFKLGQKHLQLFYIDAAAAEKSAAEAAALEKQAKAAAEKAAKEKAIAEKFLVLRLFI